MDSTPPTMRLAAKKGRALRPRHSGHARCAATTARPSAAGAIQVDERKARPSAAPNRAPLASGRVAVRGSAASAPLSAARVATSGTSKSRLRAMSCTMPMPIASCDFQGSCPARPGTTNASARPASHAGGGGRVRRGSMPRRLSGFLLGVAALELLHAARSVDDLVLAGVVGVRFRGHLDLHHRVFLAVFPLHGLAALGVDGRARQESVVRAGVEEDHRPVVGVDAWLHGRAPAEKVANYKGKSPVLIPAA